MSSARLCIWSYLDCSWIYSSNYSILGARYGKTGVPGKMISSRKTNQHSNSIIASANQYTSYTLHLHVSDSIKYWSGFLKDWAWTAKCTVFTVFVQLLHHPLDGLLSTFQHLMYFQVPLGGLTCLLWWLLTKIGDNTLHLRPRNFQQWSLPLQKMLVRMILSSRMLICHYVTSMWHPQTQPHFRAECFFNVWYTTLSSKKDKSSSKAIGLQQVREGVSLSSFLLCVRLLRILS